MQQASDNFDPDLLNYLTKAELTELDSLLASDPLPWRPLPGPQTMALESKADVVGFGGAAGGGKTDLACGIALTQHRKSGISRSAGTEMTAIVDRLEELIGSKEGYNGKDKIWRTKRYDNKSLQIELMSFPNPGDEKKHRGRPHDLLVFDEAEDMREFQVRFLMGWLRTTVPGQRCRVLMTFNPPAEVEGRWLISYFAPWLDKKYPHPAAPGELRYFATVDGKDVERNNGKAFKHNNEIIKPLSRTFIPSRITDNPYLMNTGYMSTLQAMPEPLRSQMLHGDFQAGISDDPWQVIPTEWVEAAMSRWTLPAKLDEMDAVGCDVARGGKDQTIIARRHGMWFDEPLVYPGSTTPNGPKVASLCIAAVRNQAPIHIDVIGVGSSPYDFLVESNQQVIGVNVSESSAGRDKSGRLSFRNLRSDLVWRMREALDPTNNTGIMLPDSSELLADLCAYTWKLAGSTIYVHSREEILKQIGRSPDYASAYLLALIDTPKLAVMQAIGGSERTNILDYDPYNVS